MPLWNGFSLHEASGYTLIETVVALALLMTVLVPAGALLAHFMIEQRAARHAEALALAEAMLEEMIYREASQSADEGEREASRAPWRVVRARQQDGEIVKLRVGVYWRGDQTPTVVLQTARKAPCMGSAGRSTCENERGSHSSR